MRRSGFFSVGAQNGDRGAAPFKENPNLREEISRVILEHLARLDGAAVSSALLFAKEKYSGEVSREAFSTEPDHLDRPSLK